MALLEPLVINIFYAVVSFFVAYYCIPGSKDIFMKAGLKGRDMSKKEKKEMYERYFSFLMYLFDRFSSMQNSMQSLARKGLFQENKARQMFRKRTFFTP